MRSSGEFRRSEELTLTSEFASVTISLDAKANGPRLCIVDRETGTEVYLDPLELSAIVAAGSAKIEQFVRPR